jgi:AcrR family transcriptional regulator
MKTSKSKKQIELLKIARELFWKHGFKRVSIEEVCLRAQVSKMTFYRLYPNKIELAKAVYDEEVNKGLNVFKAILAENLEPADQIRKILFLKLKGTNDISQEFIKDFYDSPELGLQSYIEEKTRLIWNEMLNYFVQAQQKGLFRKDFKPAFFLNLSSHLTGMLSDENLLKLYDTPQELIIEIANFCIYGIAPHE